MSLPKSGGNITPLLTVAQMIGFAILQSMGINVTKCNTEFHGNDEKL